MRELAKQSLSLTTAISPSKNKIHNKAGNNKITQNVEHQYLKIGRLFDKKLKCKCQKLSESFGITEMRFKMISRRHIWQHFSRF